MSEKVDWAYWSRLPEVKVFEALALLGGIEPEAEPLDIEEITPEYRKTLRLLLSCLSDRSFFTPGNRSIVDPSLHGVRLREVGNWALANGYTLPDQFPRFVRGPAQSAAAPAPVVADSARTDTTPDPERRLARLRELGGTAKYTRSVWKFTGIAALVASEKSEGRKRRDEKTIRADLREAIENEREAKRAGFAAGLGSR